jgi:heme oxygenase
MDIGSSDFAEVQILNRAPGSKTPGVIEALRFATRSRHAALASSPAMKRLFEADYTLAEYRAHLGCLLGLFEPLERAAAHAAGHSSPALQRSKDLHDDLGNMGASAEQIAAFQRCPRIPSFSAAGLRGYFYVVCGSMLGGEIIARRLRTVLGPGASYRFYGGHRTQDYGSHWASFLADLEEHGKEDVQVICATAVEVFDLYAEWLSLPFRQLGGPR